MQTPWLNPYCFGDWLTLNFKVKFHLKVKRYPILSYSGVKVEWSVSGLSMKVNKKTILNSLPVFQNLHLREALTSICGGHSLPMYSQFVAVYCYRQLRVFWHLMFLFYKNVIRFNHVVPMNWVIICSGIGMSPGPCLNIKTVLSRYGDFHVKDKTAVRTSYL